MKRITFCIDYDALPEIGGQQGVFSLDPDGWQTLNPCEELIGTKIVEIKMDKAGRLVITVEKP